MSLEQNDSLSITTERVAYWFFRLNGCLTIVNFVIHPDLPRPGDRPQRAEADILAVRFPNRCELIKSGNPMRDQEVFQNQTKIDLVIAEVKSGKCRLNGPWVKPERENIHRVLYSIGIFPEENVPNIADVIYAQKYYSDEQYQVRLFAIGNQPNTDLPPKVVQLTWNDILQFIYERFHAYYYYKTDHPQWDPIGQYLFDQVKTSKTVPDFQERVLTQMGIGVNGGV